MLDDLIARLEAATEPTRELFLAAYEAVYGPAEESNFQVAWRFASLLDAKAWTDAALMLVPPHWWWTCGNCELSGHVTIGPDYNGSHGDELKRAWPEEIWHEGIDADVRSGSGIDRVCRAICIAALKARKEADK